MTARFSIYCFVCADYRDLYYAPESESFKCMDCSTVYYADDGVFDAEDEINYQEEMKLSGVYLNQEPDWD